MTRAPRFIAFISRRAEIDDYVRREPDAGFTFASYSRLGDDVVHVRPDRLPEMVEVLAKLHETSPFDGVLNRKEKCVVPAATAANALGVRPILLDPMLARDKYRMRRALNAAEVFPRNILVASPAGVEGVPDDMFPCVLKPRFGFNSRSVCLVRDRGELRCMVGFQQQRYRALSKEDGTPADFVVEDLIPGTEHTVETLVRDGAPVLHLLSDKQSMQPPFFVEIGDLMPSALPGPLQEACWSAAAKAIERIGIRNGWTHTEVRLHEGKAVVIECAARMGGGYFEQLIQTVYGIDRMRVLMDLHLERPLPLQPEPRCFVAARRFVLEGVHQVHGLENGAEIFQEPGVSLVWPESIERISRVVVGPPHDFNNTVFEFFARADSAARAGSLADDVLRRSRVARTPLAAPPAGPLGS